MPRSERDSLGTREVPEDVYWGIQTLRAIENFPVSGRRERPELVRAYALLKQAAAQANTSLGELDPVRAEAIVTAAEECATGRFADQFPVDIFQAGAGTSFHMNVNEVIANRALEILGHPRGEYTFLSPNDHVNRAQSTNDTFPTASHIAALFAADTLLEALAVLAASFRAKGEAFIRLPKSGRTHLTDALPLTLGNEFYAYAVAVERAAGRLRERRDDLLEVPIGGTATGTGANAHPRFREKVLAELTGITALPFVPARDSFEGLQSRAQLAAFSGAQRELALELIRIANDLRLLSSGPTTGLAEITLPAVQPGSSIMAGKVNPVMAECLNMVCFQVIGNDTAVMMAATAGQIDLNVMTPVMIANILDSCSLLSAFLPVFAARCIDGITADETRLREYVVKNPILSTLIAPAIGYLKAAEIAKMAFDEGTTVREIAIREGLLSPEEADRLLDPVRASESLYPPPDPPEA
ncbi:MAG: aspartate ammonia-lyase [Methanomicrobiaceae archaeon]|nr:aspartate ammonia-lyase [Methanomicrobiaceae archaeon]